MDNAASTNEAVRREQLALVHGHGLLALTIGMALALLLALYFDPRVPSELVWIWLGARVAITLARGWTVHRNRSGAVLLALMAMDGLLWGVAGAWLAHHSDPEIVAYSVGILVSVSCIATFGLQVYPAATAAYVVPTLAPMALAMGARLDRTGLAAAVGLVLVMALQLLTARQAQRRLAETVRLRSEAEALAREKDEALALALRQSEVKSEFLGSVSHELRTPLHGMLGLARLVRAEMPQGRLRNWLELIDAAGQHLLALINDLLDAERGRVEMLSSLRPAPFDLARVLQQVVGLHQLRAREKGLRLEQHITLSVPHWVQGDERRLTQVLHNLLGNAIKFTRQGHVALSAVRMNDADMVRFVVTDTGAGIAPEDQARIFDAFARTDAARDSEGTGLGLTISRDVAHAMGGELTVHSQLGAGSTFTFTARLPTCAPLDTEREGATNARPLAGPLVLVAEDDEVNALITTATLSQLGLRHERVANGADAVRRVLDAHAERPLLVLMDCRMPLQDGYEATRQIRAWEYAQQRSRLPIIALTATATEDSRLQCIQAGMDDFLSKPYTAQELATVVQAWLALTQP